MKRALVAIPAYNEEATIAGVVSAVRQAAPAFDVLVVNDGSRDRTGQVLEGLDVTTATHVCNLGYGRTLQTAIKYAKARGYEVLVTFDADGQHQAGDIARLYEQFVDGDYDLLIGSRFVVTRDYSTEPWMRRIGMQLFSLVVRLFAGRRIYDTSSGLKVIHRRVFSVLIERPSADFHSEVIVYLLLRGSRVGEFPITVTARRHGTSMHSWFSAIQYPLKTSLLTLLSVVEAKLSRR
jgi:glycosyltransferase involved in cell wall biosynthesis